MRLITTDYDASFAKSVHRQFSAKFGAGRIASEFSLQHLSRLIQVRKPKRVLEIGAGIGTISELVLSHAERVEHLFSIEQDDFCRTVIKENVMVHNWQKWTLLRSPADLPSNEAFDLIIFDGNQYNAATFALLCAETAVFVEGKRQSTRDELAAYCQQMGLNLRLHQYKGRWHIGWRRVNDSRAFSKRVLKQDQCYIGVCKTRYDLPDGEMFTTPDIPDAAGAKAA